MKRSWWYCLASVRPRSALSWAAFCTISIVFVGESRAEEPPVRRPAEALAQAEAAYQNVDFPAVALHANRAIESGHLSRVSLGRAYWLLGVSHAATGQGAEAERAFLRLLALEPDAAREQRLSPKLRAPYLEALAQMESKSPLELQVRFHAPKGVLALRLTDDFQLVEKIQVSVRAHPDEAFRVQELAPGAEVAIQVPGTEQTRYIEYVARARDRHGNIALALGSEFVPETRGAYREARPAALSPEAGAGATQRVLGIIAMAAGLGLAGVAVPFHLEREEQARTWNGEGCERPGEGSRARQCDAVDRDRQSAELTSILLYSMGGALVTTGIVLYATAPSDDSAGEREHGPKKLGVPLRSRVEARCSLTWASLGMACQARF